MSTLKVPLSPDAPDTQGILPGFEVESPTPKTTNASAFSFQYLPSGPHGQSRNRLMRAQAILAADVPFGLSRLSVKALDAALRSFLAEVSLSGGAVVDSISSLSGRVTPSGREAQALQVKANLARRDRARFKKQHS